MTEYKNIEFKKAFGEITPIVNDMGLLEGINLKFKPKDQDQTIYETSDGTIVRDFPEELSTEGINLDFYALNSLNTGMANILSTYLFAYRKLLNGGDMSINITSSMDSNLKMRAFISKHFFRDPKGNKGRYKMKLSFIADDEDFGAYEIVMIPFTKTDIQFLFNIVRDIVTSFHRCKTIYIPATRVSLDAEENFISETTIPFAKIDNSILIGEVWLHGQELLNVLYLVDRLTYSMNIEEDLSSLNTIYRQIKVVNENGIMYMILVKKKGDHSDDPMVDLNGREYKLKIPISANVLSVMHMSLSMKSLRHADIEFEYDPTLEILGSQDPFANIKGVKYHISMRESSLGIAVDKSSKGVNRIKLIGFVKGDDEPIFDEEGNAHRASFKKGGEIINKMTFFNINLRDQWPKLIKALSIAYNQEYIQDGKEFNLMKFFVLDNAQGEKMHKYEFSILSNKDNKAKAVLVINKYDRENLIASFRQPLFDKYIFQLITMLLSAGEFIEDMEYAQDMNKLDLIKFRYKSMKRVSRLTKNEMVKYGIKKEGENTYWGIFSESNEMFDVLPMQDRYMLKISALERLLRGRWLPFVGETLCIGPDRYLTDLYGELELEENPQDEIEGFSPKKGLDWAIMLYFGTTYD